MNATKFGLYSASPIIAGGDGRESREDWEALLQALIEHFNPADDYEALLVKKIAECYWRDQRAARAEAGAITKATQYLMSRAEHSKRRLVRADIGTGEWQTNSVAIVHVTKRLENAKKIAEQSQDLPEDYLEDVGALAGQFEMDDPVLTCIARNNRWKKEKLLSPEEGQKAQRALVDCLAETIDYCRKLLPQQIEREQRSAEADLLSASIPHSLVVDPILRYEARVNRKLNSLLAQLDAAQQRRKRNRGSSSPVPINVQPKD